MQNNTLNIEYGLVKKWVICHLAMTERFLRSFP